MTPHELIAAFETLADAPDGVKRLRELVLHLAVRGKLVPQDPAEGRVPPCEVAPAPDECPFPLPEQWAWYRLPEIAAYSVGKTPPTKESRFWGQNEIPWVSIADMPDGGVVRTTARTITADAVKYIFRKPPIPAGTLLMSFKLTIGKVALLGVDACHNEAIISLVPEGNVSRDYLLRVLPLRAVGGESKDAIMGATLNSQSLARILVPVPPLAEQRRIVARVDELMSMLDRLEAARTARDEVRRAARDSALADLENAEEPKAVEIAWARIAGQMAELFTCVGDIIPLRRAVLRLAVRGRLVSQNPADESADTFLFALASVRGGAPYCDDAVNSSVLPCGWKQIPFGYTHINRDADRVPLSREERATRPGPYDYYGASGVIDQIDGYLFDKPLLLIGEDGANLVLRSSPIAFMARGHYWVNNHAHVLDSPSEYSLRYLAIFINSIDLRPYLTGTAQPKLNQARMNAIPCPFPPLAEQRRIVEKVDALMALCDQLEARLAAARDLQAQFAAAAVHHLDV